MSLLTSYDGKYFFTENFTDRVLQRSVYTAEIIRTFKTDSSMLGILALANDGKHLVTSNLGKEIQEWDTGTATILRSFQIEGTILVAGSISSDSKYLVIADMNGNIKVSELLSGKVICYFGELTLNKLPSLYITGENKYLHYAT